MNCIIIDDEEMARLVINQLCKKVDDLNVIEQFSNAIQAIKYLNQNTVDLIFLDIHMPDFTGFDFIQTLKNPPQIILTTSDPKFAIDAFEYECITDYILKPITLPRFYKSIEKVEKKLKSPIALSIKEKEVTNEIAPILKSNNTQINKELYVNIDRRLVKIEIATIYLIEAKGDYIQIKTLSKNHIVHSTLKKIEDKLPEDLFLKIHRSYIINIQKIIDIEDNSVLIQKDVVPVSRSNKPELLRRLNLL